jgi:hypothetical protein
VESGVGHGGCLATNRGQTTFSCLPDQRQNLVCPLTRLRDSGEGKAYNNGIVFLQDNRGQTTFRNGKRGLSAINYSALVFPLPR